MNIALIGYGKMGKEVERIAMSRGHKIVCVIDADNQNDFESESFRNADVAIEFTNPEVAYNNILRAFDAGVKVVSGSTGWKEKHEEDIQRLCSDGGKTLFWSSNFSLGVAVFSAVNKYLASIMNKFAEYDVTMVETHHVHKKDAPSGTAITLAEGILQNLDRKQGWKKADEPFGANDLPITSLREGEVFGIHTVCYNSDVDTISITHDAKNRGGFALGAVLAAEYTHKNKGFLGMKDLFDFLK
ncbi:MAG: 4-hydroxy-tetrahydrodipicolinate reductase [Bacteroides sp.]|nr:4-hydroxy-tetrahydrodipicolinate reductase [Bacteroides sp.]